MERFKDLYLKDKKFKSDLKGWEWIDLVKRTWRCNAITWTKSDRTGITGYA